MQTRNRLLDDFARLFTNAMGLAQGAREEAETALRSWLDRWLADRELVTRDEFEAVREMAIRARDEVETLSQRVEALEAAIADLRAAGAPKATGTSATPRATKRSAGGAKSRSKGSSKAKPQAES